MKTVKTTQTVLFFWNFFQVVTEDRKKSDIWFAWSVNGKLLTLGQFFGAVSSSDLTKRGNLRNVIKME